jgi:hypothetical protein
LQHHTTHNEKIILFLFFCLVIFSNSQVTIKQNKQDNDLKLSALPYYSFGKGLELSPDSLYQLNIRSECKTELLI